MGQEEKKGTAARDAAASKEKAAAGPEPRRGEGPGMSRRTLCLGIGGAAALLALGGVGAAMPAEALVRPPGGQGEAQLASACIRCEKCYEVCPRSVIAPSHLEDGLVQVRTPVMDFSSNWCDFCQEENGGDPLCVKCCPTQALELPAGATAESTIIGEAVIDTDTCLAYRLIGCKFCYDACPYEAIELDDEGRPHVIVENCNGCGACESVCVSLKNASITAGATHRAIIVVPVDQA